LPTQRRYKASVNIGASAICNALGEMMCGKKVHMYCYYVDGERMKEAKTKAVAEAKVEGLSFVSSNDVLTSGFASTCQPHQFTMAIQFRGRIDGLDGHDIGNYHNGVVFDRTTYSSAAGIRMALNGPKPYSRIQLPGCWRGSRCRLGMISNWVRVVFSFS
jgi:hypothetical protein